MNEAASSFVDTYELVEQALGRPLQLPKIALPA